MIPIVLALTLSGAFAEGGESNAEVVELIATIEALQAKVEDFRCEYEGTWRLMGKAAEGKVLGDAGLFESYSGIFIWKNGGDTFSDSMHRYAGDNRIDRHELVVRPREKRAESHVRGTRLSTPNIGSPDKINPELQGSLGGIFLIDKLKRMTVSNDFKLSLQDGQHEGRPVKVLEVRMRGVPKEPLLQRYYIDLGRNGHVVRVEGYSGDKVGGGTNITLEPFRIGDQDVWMPVRGDSTAFMSMDQPKPVFGKEPPTLEGRQPEPVFHKEPTSIATIYVVKGTMEFNTHPGPEVFKIGYKPGTPISDKLRKLQDEFGRQKLPPRLTNSELDLASLKQLAGAKAQKTELVAVPPSQAVDWTPRVAWGFGGLVVILSVVLWVQRRGR